MKKIYSLAFMSLMLVLFLSTAAMAKTIVAGKIYLQDMQTTVAGADVTVDCHHDSEIHTQTTTSLNDGAYAVEYNENGEEACNGGDTVVVTASKGDMSGSDSGVVHENMVGPPLKLDIAIVNVSIPEFSTVAAGIALVGAVCGFIFLRRRN